MKKFIFVSLFLFAFINLNAQPKLWSLTSAGGNSAGSIISINPDGSNFNVPYTFPVTAPGASPQNSQLLEIGSKLYGLTSAGGTYNMGVLYSYDTTQVYTALFHFSGSTTGSYPFGSLIVGSDGKLYGVTDSGGVNNKGVIFSFNLSNNTYSKLFDFAGTTTGSNPMGTLTERSGKLFGMTSKGGTNDKGTIFSFEISTSTFSNLYSFNNDGANPQGGLFYASDLNFYGMTMKGGLSNHGVVFKFNPITFTYTKLYEFGTSGLLGREPYGDFIEDGGKLYGMTSNGGGPDINYRGAIFSYQLSNSTFSLIRVFFSSTGYAPRGNLLKVGNFIYGLASLGGISVGEIFRYNLNTLVYDYLNSFVTTNGKFPYGSLTMAANGKLYGVASGGGYDGVQDFGKGVLFSYDIPTDTYVVRVKFGDSPNGCIPYSSLAKAKNGKLYGITQFGGVNNMGVIFNIDPTNNNFTKLADITLTNGNYSTSGLFQASDNKFYGISAFGGVGNNFGNLFRFDENGQNFEQLIHNFPANGFRSTGNFMQAANGKLYVMLSAGGDSSAGVIRSYDISTSTNTLEYSAATTKGSNPRGTLVQYNDSLLYGLMRAGGVNSKGVIFKFNTTNSVYSKVYDLNLAGGCTPEGGLVKAANGKLYGMTTEGGANSKGVIFSYDPALSSFSTLYSFNTLDGASPNGSLYFASDGKLYGMTTNGGTNNAGTIFKFDPLTNTLTKYRDLIYTEGATPLYSSFIEVNTITTNAVSSPLCKGSAVAVSFSSPTTYNAGNQFTALLSNSAGNFDSPTVIGTLPSTTSGTINCVIPTSTIDGTGYRIQVIASDPVVYGKNNGSDISIQQFTNSYIESFGNVGITTPIATYETNNGFDNDDLLMSGTGEIRTDQNSNNYSGASGNANVLLTNVTGRTFEISGINTSKSSSLQLSFGIYKSSAGANGSSLALEYSSDGVSYFTLAFPTLPNGSSGWYYRTANGVIPQASNLRIRFRQLSTSSQYRIDDILLTLNDTAGFIVSSAPLASCSPVSLTLTASKASSYLWSTSATTKSITTNIQGSYNCVLTSSNGCKITSAISTIFNTTPLIYSVTGGGNYCINVNNVVVGLSNSQIGVNYQLKRNNVNIGNPVSGTGSAFSFGNQILAGTYTVIATAAAACTSTMSGSAVVSVTNSTLYFVDADNDGYGNLSFNTLSCTTPLGYVTNSTDCNDLNSLEFPGQLWYNDVDGDDYGNNNFQIQCTRIVGRFAASELIATTGDCNDNNATINPGATEIPGDGIDQNCDNIEFCYSDFDNDDFGSSVIINSSNLVCTDFNEALVNTDCNDNNPLINPSATDVCNSIDDNCDNITDPGCPLLGIYCIGPGSIYTAPSGPNYINANAPYTNLTAAVNSLNTLGASGHVIFEFQNDYTSIAEGIINLTYQGDLSRTVTFRPRSDIQDTIRIIKSSANSERGLININNGDYITFDGSPGGVMGTSCKIIIRNTFSPNGAANFNLVNDASNIMINAIKIEAGNNSISCVRIDTTNGSNGNEFITIKNCILTSRSDLSTARHSYGLSSQGSVPGNRGNNNIVIENNRISNSQSNAIFIPTGNEGNWNIENNSFFSQYSTLNGGGFINFSSPENNVDLTISGNYMGGTNEFASGSAFLPTSNLNGINVSTTDLAIVNIVGNVFKKFLFANSLTLNSTFIKVNGRANITSNIIGDPLQTDDIIFSNVVNSPIKGIEVISSQNNSSIEISGNIISNISALNTNTTNDFTGILYDNVSLQNNTLLVTSNKIKSISTYNRNFTGLSIRGGTNMNSLKIISSNQIENITMSNSSSGAFRGISISNSPVTINNNRIGDFSNNDDIEISSSGSHYGIYVLASGNGGITLENDTIANMFFRNEGSYDSKGIYLSGSTSNSNSILNNTIKNLKSLCTRNNSEGSFAETITLTGILYSVVSPGASIKNNSINGLHTNPLLESSPSVSGISIGSNNVNVESNKIYNFTNSAVSLSSNPQIIGIYVLKNNIQLINNMVALSNGINQNDVNIFGILDYNFESSILDNEYSFNSISISGISGSISKSSAFWRNYSYVSAPTIRNNIFYNIRNGGGKNYAIAHASSLYNNWNYAQADYNNLYSLNAATLGNWQGTDVDFAGWKTNSIGDVNSKNVDVDFVDMSNDLHLNSGCELNNGGTPLTTITDIDNNPRNIITPDIGADEINSPLLNVHLYIQGFYAGANSMIPALFNAGVSADPLDCDSVIVELHNEEFPFDIAFSSTTVLRTDGDVSCEVDCIPLPNNYYVVVKSRNTIETWSKNPVSFSSGNVNFDFSTP